MCGSVVLEVARGQELGLDDVVEAELTDGHHHGTGRGPVGPAEQLQETFLTTNLWTNHTKLQFCNL